ncbi:hypothetical protein EDB85DRAFT_284679 [Lactarius pseudohatsudake]|nr:hypothetical protein EDB85DRAFT_284679 [Lactarius pseudohatsudake]
MRIAREEEERRRRGGRVSGSSGGGGMQRGACGGREGGRRAETQGDGVEGRGSLRWREETNDVAGVPVDVIVLKDAKPSVKECCESPMMFLGTIVPQTFRIYSQGYNDFRVHCPDMRVLPSVRPILYYREFREFARRCLRVQWMLHDNKSVALCEAAIAVRISDFLWRPPPTLNTKMSQTPVFVMSETSSVLICKHTHLCNIQMPHLSGNLDGRLSYRTSPPQKPLPMSFERV